LVRAGIRGLYPYSPVHDSASGRNGKLHRIERALLVLNLDERYLIEKPYMDQSPADDMIVCDELGWSKRTYYRIKKRVLDKLAMALNLI
jgi:ArpU family phage transcriptional regulator